MIDEKIREILKQGFDDCKEGLTYYENTVPKLKALFLQEARACLPKKYKIDIELPDTLHRNIGFNQAISQVEQNINKLSEEGER